MIEFSFILHYNMDNKCAEDPFNMGMFFDIRPPSLWVHFQTPNTHIRAFCTGVAPPPPGLGIHTCTMIGGGQVSYIKM